jgi:hypothetical protein
MDEEQREKEKERRNKGAAATDCFQRRSDCLMKKPERQSAFDG